jgi:hypothetical protein
MTDCCSHRSMHLLSRIWEASTYCTSLLAQRPTTDQGTEDKRRQKRSALNRTHILYPPLLKDHCRRGNRTNIRARGRGWLHSVFSTQRDRQLHKWTHSSLDKPNPSMMMEVRYKIPPPAMELWVTVSSGKRRDSFLGILPLVSQLYSRVTPYTQELPKNIWAVQIGLHGL